MNDTRWRLSRFEVRRCWAISSRAPRSITTSRGWRAPSDDCEDTVRCVCDLSTCYSWADGTDRTERSAAGRGLVRRILGTCAKLELRGPQTLLCNIREPLPILFEILVASLGCQTSRRAGSEIGESGELATKRRGAPKAWARGGTLLRAGRHGRPSMRALSSVNGGRFPATSRMPSTRPEYPQAALRGEQCKQYADRLTERALAGEPATNSDNILAGSAFEGAGARTESKRSIVLHFRWGTGPTWGQQAACSKNTSSPYHHSPSPVRALTAPSAPPRSRPPSPTCPHTLRGTSEKACALAERRRSIVPAAVVRWDRSWLPGVAPGHGRCMRRPSRIGGLSKVRRIFSGNGGRFERLTRLAEERGERVAGSVPGGIVRRRMDTLGRFRRMACPEYVV